MQPKRINCYIHHTSLFSYLSHSYDSLISVILHLCSSPLLPFSTSTCLCPFHSLCHKTHSVHLSLLNPIPLTDSHPNATLSPTFQTTQMTIPCAVRAALDATDVLVPDKLVVTVVEPDAPDAVDLT